jgi:tetratricopeptide (TPR) repeat protein
MSAFHRISLISLLAGCLLFTQKASFCQINIGSVQNQHTNGDNPHEDSIYAAREIPSVALSEKKYTLKRRLYQNMVSRYNFYFNANNKLTEAIETITAAHKDNFDEILPFYPYPLSEMSNVKTDLDSVIFTASVGIEVHDPRVKWMGDLYLLVGEAYYYEQGFENAEKAFQFINLTYAPKQAGDYNAIIGTQSENSESQITISTPEKQTGLLHQFKHLSSRNEALIWLAKTYTAEEDYDKAQALLNDLRIDPDFPERLKGELEEASAQFYYDQERYKEMTPYLEKAITLEDSKELKARWEYILAQLAMRNQQNLAAIKHFKSAIDYSTDPLMNFYANFNIARINISNGNGNIRQNTALLLKMARKDKYERYRDIIYYGLAKLEVNNKDTSAAQNFLLKSIANSNDDAGEKAEAANLLAELYYDQQKYSLAKNYYDTTTQFMQPGFPDSAIAVTRKDILSGVIKQIGVIDRQDSLQHLAALPETRRDSIVQEIAKAEEKTQREQERLAAKARQMMNGTNNNVEMFPGNNNYSSGTSGSSTGNWYFYNPDLKSAGYTTFRQEWGDRPLVDNWRRASAIKGFTATESEENDSANNAAPVAAQTNNLSAIVNALLNNIPLTPEKMKASNDSVVNAYFDLGNLYYLQLNDIPSAIQDFETMIQRYPANRYLQQVDYFLYLLYQKNKQPELAGKYQKQILQHFPQSSYASILQYGPAENPDSVLKYRVMHYYDTAYEHYLAGDYDAALQETSAADSLFPRNYLQSHFDLLYGMVLIKTGSDNKGRKALQDVIAQYPSDSVKSEARYILQVLDRKQEILLRLSNLKIAESKTAPQPQPVITKSYATRQSAALQSLSGIKNKVNINTDTSGLHLGQHQVILPPKPITPYTLESKNPHFVIMLFKLTDKQIIENANARFTQYLKTHPSDSSILVSPYAITSDETMLVFRLFKNEGDALNFLDQVRADANSVVPGLPANEYAFYIISRDNFIMLNQTKDLQGYIRFFNDNYVTQ